MLSPEVMVCTTLTVCLVYLVVIVQKILLCKATGSNLAHRQQVLKLLEDLLTASSSHKHSW